MLLKPPMRSCMIEIGRHMPIGLLYLASMLRDAGHTVEVFDSLAHIEDNHVVPPSELTQVDRVKIAAWSPYSVEFACASPSSSES